MPSFDLMAAIMVIIKSKINSANSITKPMSIKHRMPEMIAYKVIEIWKFRHSFAWDEPNGISSFFICHMTNGAIRFPKGTPIQPKKDDKCANIAQLLSGWGMSDVLSIISLLMMPTLIASVHIDQLLQFWGKL